MAIIGGKGDHGKDLERLEAAILALQERVTALEEGSVPAAPVPSADPVRIPLAHKRAPKETTE